MNPAEMQYRNKTNHLFAFIFLGKGMVRQDMDKSAAAQYAIRTRERYLS